MGSFNRCETSKLPILKDGNFKSTSQANMSNWNEIEPKQENITSWYALSFPVVGSKNTGLAYAVITILS